MSDATIDATSDAMRCDEGKRVTVIRPAAALILLLGVAGWIPAADEGPLPFPEMAPTVGALLDRDYYDKSRFKARTMVERALRSLETAQAGVDARWTGTDIALQLAERSLTVPAPEPQTLADAMAILERVRVAVEKDGVEWTPKERRELVYAMLNGALTCLDPHTMIMPPEPANDFQEDIQGEFFGIGAFLNQEEGVISIERVMPGLPAELGGVEDGDIILGIDGEKTVGLSLDQAVRRIKGPKGTTVVLTIERKGSEHPIDLAITRDLVQVITMRSWRDGGIAYVRMDEFNANTARDLWSQLLNLQQEGPIEGFVLDLRFNGGGLLEQARMVSDFFLAKNLEIVRTVTVDGEPQKYTSSARANKPLQDIPMLVMTSGGSASAAEILAGALQRNDRAVVIGATTFGKGSVQSIRSLRDASRLKLTIQEYQLPGGVSIQDVGVVPDIALIRHGTREDGTIDLVPYTGMREGDDEFALGTTADHAYKHQSAYQLGWLADWQSKEQARASSISSRDFAPDQEARLVIDLMRAALASPEADVQLEAGKATDALRMALVKLLEAPVAERAERESARLSAALAERTPPIAWGTDAAGEPGALSIEFKGPATVTAGASAELQFTVANRSGIDVGRTYGVVRSVRMPNARRPDFGPFWEQELLVGAVPAGGSVSAALRVDVPPRLHAGEERFVLELHRNGGGEILASTAVSVTVEEKPRPHFSYRWELQDPDGQLAVGESSTVRLTLINDGAGDSVPVNVYVFKDNDPYVQLGEGRWKLEPLKAGASTTLDVPITVLSELMRAGKPVPYAGETVKLQVRVDENFADTVDGRYRGNLFHTLTLPVGKPVAGAHVVQPAIDLLSVETMPGDHARLRVRVKDDNLRYVALFHDEDKVDLALAATLVDGVYETTVPLKAGVNALRVLASDADEVSELLPLRLWGPDPAPEAAVATPAPKRGEVETSTVP